MTTTQEIALPSTTSAAQRADFISQTTAVEQARAEAEVKAQVIVAHQVPRDLQAALVAMRESCNQPGLADRAFYKFPRAGGSVSGASVHLARELARCWGNLDYGIMEMRRDEVGHYSEMKAWAWDMQTNTRSSQTFVVPHKRDKKGGPELLIDLRDVYENNANQGARRVREAIFSVLPTWFTEEAKALCTKTLTDGGGKPLAQSIADAVRVFEGIGIKVDRLERKIEAAAAQWTAHDVAQLRVSFASLQQGTVTADEEFPPERVTAEDITAAPAPAVTPAPAPRPDVDAETGEVQRAEPQPAVDADKGAPPPADKTAIGAAEPPPASADRTPWQMIGDLARDHGVVSDKDRYAMVSQILGRDIASAKDVKGAASLTVRTFLGRLQEGEAFPWAQSVGGEVVDSGSPAEAAVDSASTTSAEPPSQQRPDPSKWTPTQWSKFVTDRGLTVAAMSTKARSIASEMSLDWLGMSGVPGSAVAEPLLTWVLEQSTNG